MDHLSEEEFQQLMKLDWQTGNSIDAQSAGFKIPLPMPFQYALVDAHSFVVRWYSAQVSPEYYPSLKKRLMREAIILAPHYECFAWFHQPRGSVSCE